MITLIVDTAFEFCQVGLFRGTEQLDARTTQSGGRHDHVLANMVQEIFTANQITAKDLSRIVVTTGPGRFTGLRVGIAFARGLALVHDTPLVGVLTTDALALDVVNKYGANPNVAIMVAVKRGESFVQMPCTNQIIRVMDRDLGQSFATPMTIAGMISPEARPVFEELPQIQIDNDISFPSLGSVARAAHDLIPGDPVLVRPFYAL